MAAAASAAVKLDQMGARHSPLFAPSKHNPLSKITIAMFHEAASLVRLCCLIDSVPFWLEGKKKTATAGCNQSNERKKGLG